MYLKRVFIDWFEGEKGIFEKIVAANREAKEKGYPPCAWINVPQRVQDILKTVEEMENA